MSDLTNFLVTSAGQSNMCFPLQGGFETTASFFAKCGSEQDFLLGKIVTDLKGQKKGSKRKVREGRRDGGERKRDNGEKGSTSGGGKQKEEEIKERGERPWQKNILPHM